MVIKVVFDLALANHQLTVHFTLTQTSVSNFAANFLPKFFETYSILLQLRAKFGQRREFIFLGDALQGFVELDIINAYTSFLGKLDLQHFRDHPFQYLLLQQIWGRQRCTLFFQLAFYVTKPVFKFVKGNRIVVYNCNNLVNQSKLRLRRDVFRCIGGLHINGGRYNWTLRRDFFCYDGGCYISSRRCTFIL